MSKKASKAAVAAVASKKRADDDDREESLQAVILTDSFETRFKPFTAERPRCLLPLANTPLIEYTFEFLAGAGIQEVIVYCGAHAEQVEEYIRTSRWRQPHSPLRKLDIIKTASRSTGDVMRDLDSRNIIKGDFVVLSADVISTIPLAPALARHRARRAADKNAIMTMILREAGVAHRTKPRRPAPVFVIDPTHDRCLHYEEIDALRRNSSSNKNSGGKKGRVRRGSSGSGGGGGSQRVHIDTDFLSSQPYIDLRADLIDCRIDICTPDVLALWTDSFDYEAPRKHFLYGVLKDHELNGKTIHVHIVDDAYSYGARVGDLAAYDAVSKDLISRWAYPVCPDSNLLPDHTYRYQPDNIYLEDNVVLARSCTIASKTVVGQGSSIGDDSIIADSVIGRRCRIGRNVRIHGAYVWDDVTIADNVHVRQAIIASGAVVEANATIEPGALISFNARIAKGTTVSGTSKITSHTPAEALDANGHDYADSASDGDDEDDERPAVGLLGSDAFYSQSIRANASDLSVSTLDGGAAATAAEEDDDGTAEQQSARNRRQSASSTGSGHDSHHHRHHYDDHHHHDRRQGGGHHQHDFYHDAMTSIFDALQNGDGPHTMHVELQALRMGADADYHVVRRALAAAFLNRAEQLLDQRQQQQGQGRQQDAERGRAQGEVQGQQGQQGQGQGQEQEGQGQGQGQSGPSTSVSVSEVVTPLITTYRVLFEKTIFDHHDSKSTPPPAAANNSNSGASDADAITITKPDQVDLLMALQGAAAPRARGDSLLLFMAKALYDTDVLEEDALMQWWRSGASASTTAAAGSGGAADDMRRVRARMQPFIDWLANAAEDDDDDDDDDDDNDDDEEEDEDEDEE